MSSLLDDLDDLGGSDDDQLPQMTAPASSGAGVKRSAAAAFGVGAASSSSAAADLADLDDSDDEGGGGGGGGDGAAAAAAGGADSDDDSDDEGGAAAGSSSAAAAELQEEPRDAALEAELAALEAAAGSGGGGGGSGGGGRRTGYKTVAKLRDTARFASHMAAVEAALAAGGAASSSAAAAPSSSLAASASSSSSSLLASSSAVAGGSLEGWSEYPLLVASNALITAIDDEYAALHAYIAGAYAPKFPELSNILPAPGDYIRVVRAIGNEADMTLVEALPSLLPSAQVMVVTVTGSVTDGKPLPPPALADVLAACDEAAALEAAKGRILAFIESRMATLAPNTSALLGPAVAARLVGIAGGLGALARIPGCNIQVLGQKRRGLAGLSRTGGGAAAAAGGAPPPHMGVIYDCDLVQAAPSALRRKTVKVLAQKVALAARVDVSRQRPDGGLGAGFRDFVAGRVRTLMEPPPGKTKRPLPAPDDKPSKKRGGRRARALKAKLGMTDVRREASRLTFATTAIEYSDLSMGRDSGRLGEGGGTGGRMRLERKEQRIGLSNKRKKMFDGGGAAGGGGGGYLGLGGSSGATGGAASSMAFTPGQGLALHNPAAAAARAQAASESAGYFSSAGSFSVVRKGT
jgi:U4/U6 small nuclear ribonucleoprotein PRP31